MANKSDISDYANIITGYIKKALDILFIRNQLGSSIGVLLGYTFSTITCIFKPTLNTLKFIDLLSIKTHSWIILGVVMVNIPYLFRYKRFDFDKDIEQGFAMIKEAEKSGKFENWQIAQMYRNLNETVLQRIQLVVDNNQVKNEESLAK